MKAIRVTALTLVCGVAGAGTIRTAAKVETPVSFAYDGRVADLSQWQRSKVATADAPELVRSGGDLDGRAPAWTDRATGLRVVTASTRYPHGAREWVHSFQNTGQANTPLIEDIQALDLVVPLPSGACTVHHSLGDRNSADSFRPLADALALGGELKFGPVGDRSSDGHMPYFNRFVAAWERWIRTARTKDRTSGS